MKFVVLDGTIFSVDLRERRQHGNTWHTKRVPDHEAVLAKMIV